MIQPDEIRPWESGEIDRIACLVNADPGKKEFVLVENSDDADIIVLLESCTLKSNQNINDYKKLIDFGYRGGRKLFVINYEDVPPGVFPGLYSSLESSNYDGSLHLSWPHLRLPNELVEMHENQQEVENTYLFSFSGSCSHSIRKKLFSMYSGSNGRYMVREITRWYNHEPDEKASYVDEISRSMFVLCPRGIASYSHRIVETMALGRVPVIIADNWVPFSIDHDNYYVRIKESDVGRIDEILQSHLSSYKPIRESVRFVYNSYFAPGTRYTVALNQLVELSERIPGDLDAGLLKRRLNSCEFRTTNGWLFRQRMWRIVNNEIVKRSRQIKRIVLSKVLSRP